MAEKFKYKFRLREQRNRARNSEEPNPRYDCPILDLKVAILNNTHVPCNSFYKGKCRRNGDDCSPLVANEQRLAKCTEEAEAKAVGVEIMAGEGGYRDTFHSPFA